MIDIVERLIKVAELDEARWPDHPSVARDAISEIEQLRATIEQMRAVTGVAMEGKPFTEIKKEIRDGK